MKRMQRRASLVVIEFSATWPTWLDPTDRDMAIVAQHYEGRPASLVTQVASRTTRLESVGWQLDSLVLVSNGRVDSKAEAARSVLARGLAARLEHRGRGQLVLTVDERAGRRAGASLRALGSAVVPLFRKSPVDMLIRIGDRIERLEPGGGVTKLLELPAARNRPPESVRPYAPGFFVTG